MGFSREYLGWGPALLFHIRGGNRFYRKRATFCRGWVSWAALYVGRKDRLIREDVDEIVAGYLGIYV